MISFLTALILGSIAGALTALAYWALFGGQNWGLAFCVGFALSFVLSIARGSK